MENLHLVENKTNYDWLRESKEQLAEGHFAVHDLDEGSSDE